MSLLLLPPLLLFCLLPQPSCPISTPFPTPNSTITTTPTPKLFCEATPVEYDNTLSLFCQEDDLAQNLTQITSQTGVNFPDLIPSLKKSILTYGEEETQEVVDGQIANITYIDVDPSNVSDLSVWARFDEIRANAFAQFPNLRQLHVAQFYDDESRAVLVREHAFAGLDRLEWLGLHLNFSHVQIPEAVYELRSLISLGLYESDLNHLDFALGPELANLRSLTIYDSPRMELAADAFKYLESSLNELDFSNVRISKFPPAISNLKNLSRLEIAATQLHEIPADAFLKSASSLLIIRLSRNAIVDLAPRSFRGLSKLKVLQLAYNFIETIPDGVFGELTALEVLNLSGNKIRSLPTAIFEPNRRLHILDLDENPMNASVTDFLKEGNEEDGGMMLVHYGDDGDLVGVVEEVGTIGGNKTIGTISNSTAGPTVASMTMSTSKSAPPSVTSSKPAGSIASTTSTATGAIAASSNSSSEAIEDDSDDLAPSPNGTDQIVHSINITAPSPQLVLNGTSDGPTAGHSSNGTDIGQMNGTDDSSTSSASGKPSKIVGEKSISRSSTISAGLGLILIALIQFLI